MAHYRRLLRASELDVKVTGRRSDTTKVLLVCLTWWLFIIVLVLIVSAPHFLKLRRVGWDKAIVLGEEGREINYGTALDPEDLDSASLDLSEPFSPVSSSSSSNSDSSDASLPQSSSPSAKVDPKQQPSRVSNKPITFLRDPHVGSAIQSVNFKIEPLLNRNAPSLEENAHTIMFSLVSKWTVDLIEEAESELAKFNASSDERAKEESPRSSNDCSVNAEDGVGSDEFVPCNIDEFVEDGGRVHSYVGLPLCPAVPDNLEHQRSINLTSSAQVDRAELNEKLEGSGVTRGGEWMPRRCLARHKVVVVVPYRDRAAHLLALLKELHALLQSQDLHYKIVVAEQMGSDLFNKGMLMNAGFLTAISEGWWDCVIFHDVDLVPEDGRNMYSCPPRPRHLSVAVDKLNYTLPYYYLMGGVVAFRTEHFLKVNGYSNLYWGWGGEDDDMGQRVLQSWATIDRPLFSFGRYKMLPHVKRRSSVPTVVRRLLRTAGVRRRLDGLNSISFRLVEASVGQRAYTRYLIDVGPPPETISKLAGIQERQWTLVKKLRRG